jgi:Pentapeptide repeats (8 copies)
MTDPRPFLDVILGHAGQPDLPDGYDTWGFKIVRPDLRSYGGFRWPWPDLRGADLRGANLQGAYLRGADLRGAIGVNQ